MLYAITIPGTFVYDDVAIIETDRRIADPAKWGEYWTDSYNFGVDNLYRPLVSMSYAIQHYLHGPWPMPFHLVNVMLHAFASALVARFATRLAARCEMDRTTSSRIGLIAGVLFAAHPVHVEAVANVVGRAELMCAIGTIGAMLLFLHPLTPARVAGVYACFVLALLSKEQGMLVPLLLGVLAYVFSGPLSLWESVRVKAERHGFEVMDVGSESHKTADPNDIAGVPSPRPSPSTKGVSEPGKHPLGPVLFLFLAITLAGYVVYRESILKFWWDKNFLDPWIQPLAGPEVSTLDRLLVPIAIAGRYLELLVAPVALRIDYGRAIVSGQFDPADPFFYLGLGAIGLWITLFVTALRQRDRFTLVCLLCFAFIYGLLGNIVTLIGVNMAERLMYLPSVFFVMIAARWLVRLPSRAVFAAVFIIGMLFSVRTVTYAMRWNDRLGFYVYSAEVEPRSLKAVQLAMQEFLDRGQLDDAEAWGRRAIAMQPDLDDVYLRLASVMIEKGRFEEADELLLKAQDLNPPGRWSVVREDLNARRASTRPAE